MWRGGRRGVARAVGSALVFALALFSKESVALLPLCFPALGAIVERRRERPGVALLRTIPHLLVLAGWAIVRIAYASILVYGLERGIPSPGEVLEGLRSVAAHALGISPLAHPVLPWLAWGVLVSLLVCHGNWGVRLAGILWVALAVAPHLHLRYQGTNYVSFALPWVTYSLVRAGTLLTSQVRLPHARSVLGLLVCAVLAVSSHHSARRAGAPLAALEDMRRILAAKGPCGRVLLHVGVASESPEVRDTFGLKAIRILRCGTAVGSVDLRVRGWDGGEAPPGATVGESLGLRWWLWSECRE